MTPDEAEARQREVLGAPMRIAELPQDELSAEVRELVTRIGATLGIAAPETLTTYFCVLARHPDLFRLQLETGIFLFQGSAIPARERELAVLRVAWLAGAPYEWVEHVSIAHKLGISAEETDRVREGAGAAGWTDHEAAILTAVEELFANKMISDPTWGRLAAQWDEAQLIELPCLVGQYLGVAMLQNSLRIPLTRNRKGFADR